MDILRWGIIGCGDIVRRRVGPALQAAGNCTIAGVARNDPDRLDYCRGRLRAARGFRNWQEMVQDPGIDAIYIASPVCVHAEQALAALQSNKHVLCEKPLGMNAEECRQVLAASQQSSGCLEVAYYRRYYPLVRRMKEIIESGEIGDVILASAEAWETFLPDVDHPRHWILEKARSGGGSLMDFGCHRIEVLLYLLGREVGAGGAWGRAYPGHDVEDTATAAIQFRSGATGVVTVIRGGTAERDVINIQGTRGVLQVENLNGGLLKITGEEDSRMETLSCQENPHLPLIEAFCAAIREDRPPDIGAEMGWRIQRIIDAVYLSRPLSVGE